jgi:cell division protein FtsW
MWRTTTLLATSALLLTALGLVMLASTSAMQGMAMAEDPHYFVKRQVAALILGLVGALVAARVDYRVWKKWAVPFGVLALVVLVITLIPGIGIAVKGSRRWLPLGPLTMQSSEIGKLALIFLVAWWMSNAKRQAHELGRGLAVPGLLMGALILPVLASPDFGTTMLMGAVGLCILWAGGSRPSHLIVSGTLAFIGMVVLIMQNEVRMRRVIAFLDPERYADREAFQLLNAIYAFVMGGAGGVGLGGSLQKRHYLPEAHTDFIFAIIGEELGFAASLGVLVLFAVIFVCGLRIAGRAPDSFGRLTAIGLTCMITLQAAINLGVVTGCLPTKGLPLPFISYGGTSLAFTLVMVGLLVGIAHQSDGPLPMGRDKTGPV